MRHSLSNISTACERGIGVMRAQFPRIPRMWPAMLSKKLKIFKWIKHAHGSGPAKACTLARFVELGTASHARTTSG
jgi:hypothetical protein